MPRPDGLKRLPDEIAEALARALAKLPDPARDDRLFLRPICWGQGSAKWLSREQFDVYCRGKQVGCIKRGFPSAAEPWTWSIAGGPDGRAETRDKAMAAFRVAWDSHQQSDAG